MTERELENRLRVRYGERADDGAPAALRMSVAAIPDTVAAPGWGIRGLYPAQRPLALVAAMLLLAAALAGGIAVGSGLLRLPWQHSTLIDPAGIAPCDLVSGGPSQERTVTDDGVPAIGAPNLVDYEDWVNREGQLELFSAIGGKGCFFLLPPDAGDSRRADSVLHFRSHATTNAEARELAATIFANGPSPFDQGPIVKQVGGHRAWVGILGERPSVLEPIGSDRWLETFTPRMAVAISAEPYFIVVTFDIDESILGLSDAAWTKWWERQWESAFWPGIRTPVEEILTRLAQQDSTPIDPAGIAPCELVSGEPVSGGTPTDEGVWPPNKVPDDPYQAGYVNRLGEFELFTTVSGRTCSFFQQPNRSTGRMTPYNLLLFRSQATTGPEARQLAATIFTVGPSPFDQGPIVEQIGGHRAWVGILGEREPMVGHAVWEEFIPRMAVAVSAEPYFFVVTFHIAEGILDLSDAAWAKWWEREWESAFWPGVRTPVEEILSRLTQLESTEAD